jgi:hypothetical protein
MSEMNLVLSSKNTNLSIKVEHFLQGLNQSSKIDEIFGEAENEIKEKICSKLR